MANAQAGRNLDILELARLTVPIRVDQGGTGATEKTQARKNLGVFEMPAGAVMHFAMDTAPSGWLECDGSAVSRTTYATLFAAIGTTFGDGDGSATFDLPDLRGEFVRGWDHGRGVDDSRTFGSPQSADIGPHTHNLSLNASGASGAPGLGVDGGTGGAYNKATAENSGTETRPRNVALLPCIKT